MLVAEAGAIPLLMQLVKDGVAEDEVGAALKNLSTRNQQNKVLHPSFVWKLTKRVVPHYNSLKGINSLFSQ